MNELNLTAYNVIQERRFDSSKYKAERDCRSILSPSSQAQMRLRSSRRLHSHKAWKRVDLIWFETTTLIQPSSDLSNCSSIGVGHGTVMARNVFVAWEDQVWIIGTTQFSQECKLASVANTVLRENNDKNHHVLSCHRQSQCGQDLCPQVPAFF